ncbi:MAG: DUF1385 domain-containing protein [Bryobacteraceae bacterium]|nr:DUF1385 domain-containing protein [Bryobacteraceae bacterium]
MRQSGEPFLYLKTLVRFAVHTQLLPVLESGEETLVGGQAVMEGVMMRAPHSYCVAVRKPDGEIVTEENPLPRMSEKYPIFKYPVLRGIGTLGQAMWLGMQALKFSADAALSAEPPQPEGKKVEISSRMMWLNLAFSLVFFIFLYKFVPLLLTTQLEKVYPVLHGRIAFNFVDGIIRMGIFLSFLWLISRMEDIRRVFMYHGAEHKVVFNFESGQPVNVANAQKFVTWHPRCGTSFLLVVMVISMVIYALLPIDSFAGKFLARIALLPVIVGLSYELIRYAAKRRSGLMALLTAPGLWLQRITTKEPTDDQTAIAIHALDGAMKLEAKQGGELVIA